MRSLAVGRPRPGDEGLFLIRCRSPTTKREFRKKKKTEEDERIERVQSTLSLSYFMLPPPERRREIEGNLPRRRNREFERQKRPSGRFQKKSFFFLFFFPSLRATRKMNRQVKRQKPFFSLSASLTVAGTVESKKERCCCASSSRRLPWPCSSSSPEDRSPSRRTTSQVRKRDWSEEEKIDIVGGQLN